MGGEPLSCGVVVNILKTSDTFIITGYVTMKTTALSVDSAVARMVRLVEEAQNQRSSTEMLVERIAKYYTPGKPFSQGFLSCEINTRYCHV